MWHQMRRHVRACVHSPLPLYESYDVRCAIGKYIHLRAQMPLAKRLMTWCAQFGFRYAVRGDGALGNAVPGRLSYIAELQIAYQKPICYPEFEELYILSNISILIWRDYFRHQALSTRGRPGLSLWRASVMRAHDMQLDLSEPLTGVRTLTHAIEQHVQHAKKQTRTALAGRSERYIRYTQQFLCVCVCV